ncbi:type II toxin-antitoxin system RelE/ParE family toxin [Methylobacterium bullatum]|uniref:type II toxin-antitoxin system RelE/ParE family toxin n=1 Tax=Methylobacterium bullatum TaxID=570505 RepID=UPI0030D031DA
MSGSLATAQGFVARLRRQCHRLATLPGRLGRARPELHSNLRSFPCENYVIFFRYDAGTVGNRRDPAFQPGSRSSPHRSSYQRMIGEVEVHAREAVSDEAGTNAPDRAFSISACVSATP